MKTYDVYKLAIEEGKTRFKRKSDGLIYEWCPKSSYKLKPIDESAEWWSIKLDEEWEEAPVSFMTAVKSDFFTVKHDFMPSGEDVFTPSSLIGYFWNHLDEDEIKDVILNGKFYL